MGYKFPQLRFAVFCFILFVFVKLTVIQGLEVAMSTYITSSALKSTEANVSYLQPRSK